MTCQEEMMLISIALSKLVTNLFAVSIESNFSFYFMDDGKNYGYFHILKFEDDEEVA